MVWKELAVITVFLLLSTSVSAIWEPVMTDTYLGVNNNAYIEGYNIRVKGVDVGAKEAEVFITTSKGKHMYDGKITMDEGYVIDEKAWFKAAGFDYYDSAHPRVLLEVHRWVEASITEMNLPDNFYKSDTYKVYVKVQNNGPTENDFNVILSSQGKLHIENTAEDIPVKYTSTIKNVIPEASQLVTIGAGETAKVYFLLQPRGKEGEETSPVFKVNTATGQEVYGLAAGPITIVNQMTGYIEDIIVNAGMQSGVQEKVLVKVRNSWIGASNDFYVKLIAPEFKILSDSTQRVKAFPQLTDDVTYKVVPFGGGYFTVTAELSIGRNVVDTLSTDISVVGDKIYAITSVEAPKELEVDETGMVFVTIENKGQTTNIMSLKLSSKDLEVQSPVAVIKLASGDKTRALFNIKAKENNPKASFSVELYDLPETFAISQYNKQGKLIDSSYHLVKVGEEIIPEPIVKEPVVEEEEYEEVEVVVIEEDEEPVPEQEPQEVVITPTKDTFTLDEMQGFWPYIIIIALVILAVILIIAGEKSRKGSKVEVYEVEEKPKKKAKKSSKKK
ncbi:hypothetical protein ACFL1B_02860 [Nanoarchaeota archaeon]